VEIAQFQLWVQCLSRNTHNRDEVFNIAVASDLRNSKPNYNSKFESLHGVRYRDSKDWKRLCCVVVDKL